MDLASNNFFFLPRMDDVKTKIQGYVDDINAHVENLESRGPVSKYTLPDEGLRGRCFLFSLLNNSLLKIPLLKTNDVLFT